MSSGIEGIEYTVRRSERARRVRISVDPDKGVEVVIPARGTLREAEATVRHFRPWIEKRIAELDARRAELDARGNTLPYLDGTLTLVPEEGRARAHRHGDLLYVPERDPGAAIERWYRRMARDEITPRLDAACSQLGVAYSALSIRAQKTRWGSCSRSGAISFNWRLLMAPTEVLDYVIWHEACHRRVMDHSTRFWTLVAEHCPDHRAHAAWLRTNGHLLVIG